MLYIAKPTTRKKGLDMDGKRMGRVKKQLLAEVEKGGLAVISAQGLTRSQVESRRRAARELEKEGLLGVARVTHNGRSRAVAMSPDEARKLNLSRARTDQRKAVAAKEKAEMRLRTLGYVE